MKQSYPEYWSQYFTATIYEWKHLLAEDLYKDIIVDSLKFLVLKKWIELNASKEDLNLYPQISELHKILQQHFSEDEYKRAVDSLKNSILKPKTISALF